MPREGATRIVTLALHRQRSHQVAEPRYWMRWGLFDRQQRRCWGALIFVKRPSLVLSEDRTRRLVQQRQEVAMVRVKPAVVVESRRIVLDEGNPGWGPLTH